MVNDVYLDKNIAENIFHELGMDFVPFFEFQNLEEAIEYVKEAKESVQCPGCQIEGLVCFPQQRIYDHMGNRIIVKIKKKDLKKLI